MKRFDKKRGKGLGYRSATEKRAEESEVLRSKRSSLAVYKKRFTKRYMIRPHKISTHIPPTPTPTPTTRASFPSLYCKERKKDRPKPFKSSFYNYLLPCPCACVYTRICFSLSLSLSLSKHLRGHSWLHFLNY